MEVLEVDSDPPSYAKAERRPRMFHHRYQTNFTATRTAERPEQ
jgi:hypothetical protein